MLSALRYPTYLELFGSQIASLIGSGLLLVALSLTAYDIAPEKASSVLGLIFTIKIVAYVVFSPFVKAALHRLPDKAVLIGADLLRTAIAMSIPFSHSLTLILVEVFVLQLASAVYTPTYQALLPRVLTVKDDYTGALSLARIAEDLEAIASPLLAAALLLVMSTDDLYYGTALGFAFSAGLVTLCQLSVRGATTSEDQRPGFLRRSLAGVTLSVSNKGLRPLLGFGLAEAMLWSYPLVLTVVLVRRDLGLDEKWVAVLLACFGAGSIASASAVPAALKKFETKTWMFAGMAVAIAAMLGIAVALSTDLPVGVGKLGLLWALLGAGLAAASTPIGRVITEAVLEEQLDDAFAGQFVTSHAWWLLAYPLAGALGNGSLAVAAWVSAGTACVAMAGAALLWRKPFATKELLVPATPPVENAETAAEALKLLAEPTRLSILALLKDNEMAVGAIAEELGRPTPAISQHLAKLRAAKLVTFRKEGTTTYYSQKDEHVDMLVTNALHFAEHMLYAVPPHHA